jgi:hypothetical protein
MSAALSIVFTGLCALVTDGERAPGQVLLVDTRGIGEIGGVVLPEHAPTLVANLGILTNAESSRPSRVVTAWPSGAGAGAAGVDQIGLWDLRGSEVRIRVRGREGTGLELYQPAPGASSWPKPPGEDDRESWRDLRFVPSMKTLTGDGRIDPALVAVDGAASSLPRGVAARILLDSGRVEGSMPSLGNHGRDVYEFRGARPGPTHRQALTDTIRWSLVGESTAVVIEIAPLDGGPVKHLVLAPSATPQGLFISNLPAENVPHDIHHAMSDEEMGVLHFGAYYQLLMNDPIDKPLPWIWEPQEAATGAGLMARPICSPAVFSRR